MYSVPSVLPGIMRKQTPSWDFVSSITLLLPHDMRKLFTASNESRLSIGMSITATVRSRFSMKIDRYFLSAFINSHFIPEREGVQNKEAGGVKDTR